MQSSGELKKMKKIFILGGNGFLGRNLAQYLAEQGEDVYSFDMSIPPETHQRVHYIEGDFFDDYTLEQVIKDMDVIYHAISTVNPGNSNEKCVLGYERDFVQTVKLCNLIKDTDIRMIFFSSGGTIYGNQDIQPIKESAVPVPINHYGNIKLCIENTMRTFNFQAKKNMLIARISNPYGPGQDYQKGVGFVDAIIKRSLKKEPVEVWGDGNIIRDYIYIDDLCKMLYSLVDYKGESEVFNLSSNTGKSQNEIIARLKELEPGLKVIYKPGRNVDAKKIVLDNEKILSICNIKMTTFENGFQKYYEYVKETENCDKIQG